LKDRFGVSWQIVPSELDAFDVRHIDAWPTLRLAWYLSETDLADEVAVATETESLLDYYYPPVLRLGFHFDPNNDMAVLVLADEIVTGPPAGSLALLGVGV
jgi:hypothetical protein